VERLAQVDRKTVRRSVTAAGRLSRDGGDDQLNECSWGWWWRRSVRTVMTVTVGRGSY